MTNPYKSPSHSPVSRPRKTYREGVWRGFLYGNLYCIGIYVTSLLLAEFLIWVMEDQTFLDILTKLLEK